MFGETAPRIGSNFFVNTNGTITIFPAPGLASVASNTGATVQINGFRNQRNLVLQAVTSSGNLLSCRSTSGEVLTIGSTGAVVAQSSMQINGGLYSYSSTYLYGYSYHGGQADFQGAVFDNGAYHGHITLVTTDYDVLTTDLYLLVDATSASAQCTGTPGNACSTHADEAACNANDAHGGCTWNAGNSCSAFNGDSGTCMGTSGCSYPGNLGDCSTYNGNEGSCTGTSGCTWDTADCSAFNGDSATCGSTSGCTQNYSDCSAFDGDEGTCGTTSGCTQNYIDCSSYGDEGSCVSDAHCTWNGMSCDGGNHFHSCSGTYFSSCTGTYYPGTCSGNYDDGQCTGTYGAGCEGSPTCSGINDSVSCGAETGCSWTTGISLRLPSSVSNGRTLYIKKIDSSGNAVNIIPYTASGHTIELTTSLALSAQHRATVIGYYARSYDCSTYNGTDQSTCETGHAGCTWTDNSCSGYGDQSSCESAGCYWNGSSCLAVCSGTFYTYNWYELAARRGV